MNHGTINYYLIKYLVSFSHVKPAPANYQDYLYLKFKDNQELTWYMSREEYLSIENILNDLVLG